MAICNFPRNSPPIGQTSTSCLRKFTIHFRRPDKLKQKRVLLLIEVSMVLIGYVMSIFIQLKKLLMTKLKPQIIRSLKKHILNYAKNL